MEESEERRCSSVPERFQTGFPLCLFLTPMALHGLTGSSGPGPSLFGSGLSMTLWGRLMDKERVQVRECRDALRGILRAALCAVSSLIGAP